MSFLLSHSPRADHWLVGSGANSNMTDDRSALLNVKPDRRAIRLPDGRVIYLKGISSIHFLSDCGYIINIHDVLFVPFARLGVRLCFLFSVLFSVHAIGCLSLRVEGVVLELTSVGHSTDNKVERTQCRARKVMARCSGEMELRSIPHS